MSELESWKQMQALKNDHESLRKIYNSLTVALEEGNGQEQAQQDVHVVKYSAKESNYNPETASIKEQLENSREKLNSMQVVASVHVPENMTNKREAADWAVDLLKSTGYQVDRQGFGKISFNANDINYAMNYADTPAEKAAIAALPKVLKRGIQIGNHSNHKGREKATITFAAPVELNGIRGNMAATVVLRGNHYYTHRIVLPDGSAFEFGTQKKEAVREPHRGVTVSSSLADATSTASKDIVRQNTGNVNAETGVQEDAGVKFSLKETVEETHNLLAVHNLTEENVLGALRLGGMPMPSIAVIKAESGHTKYGPISFVFDKNSIDPEADSRNKIYGGDAWTPTAPQVEYPVNDDIRRAFERRIDELSGSVADGMFRRGSVLGALGVDDVSDMSVEQLAQRLAGQDAVKAAYLAQKGVKLEPVIRYAEDAVDSLGNDALQTYMDAVGTESLESELEALTAGAKEETAAALKKVRDALYAHFRKKRPFSSENSMRLRADKVGEARASEFVKNAMEYAQNGALGKQVVDRMATQDKLSETAKRADVSVWVQGEINGMLGEAGIYNGKERFTPSGNSRSFEALHYAYTLENIVKAMSKTQKARGEGVLGTAAKSMQAMAGDEYGTIADVRRDSGRLARVNEETLKARLKEVDGQIKEIIRGVRKTNQAYSDNSFEEEENIGAALMEAAQEKRTAEAVKRAMAKNGYTLSDALAEKAVDMYKAAASLPTEYFEAKPRRAVGFDEVRPSRKNGQENQRENGLNRRKTAKS